MTNPQPTRPATSSSPAPPRRRLLTRDQVLARLREERGMLGLTATADKYSISAQQLCDVLAGRAQLSKRMAAQLRYRLHQLYEKVGE